MAIQIRSGLVHNNVEIASHHLLLKILDGSVHCAHLFRQLRYAHNVLQDNRGTEFIELRIRDLTVSAHREDMLRSMFNLSLQLRRQGLACNLLYRSGRCRLLAPIRLK